MKKIVMTLLLAVLIAVSCSACGAGGNASQANPSAEVQDDVLQDAGFLQCAKSAFQEIGIQIDPADFSILTNEKSTGLRNVEVKIAYHDTNMHFTCYCIGSDWRPVSITDMDSGKYYWLDQNLAGQEDIYAWETGELISKKSEEPLPADSESIEHVSYDDISSGSYNGKDVFINCVVSNVRTGPGDYVSFIAWVSNGEGYQYAKVWNVFDISESSDLGVLNDAQDGDVFEFCVTIESDGSFGGSGLKSAEKLDSNFDIAALKEAYKNEFTPRSCEELSRMPDKYKGEKIKISGEVFQIVKEQNNSVELLIDTGESNGIVYLKYDRDQDAERFLEGDQITAYGYFYNLTDYTSVLGSKRTVPLLWVSFVDRTD